MNFDTSLLGGLTKIYVGNDTQALSTLPFGLSFLPAFGNLVELGSLLPLDRRPDDRAETIPVPYDACTACQPVPRFFYYNPIYKEEWVVGSPRFRTSRI